MNKTALVTGGTGLLGRQVVQVFQRAGWQVTGTGFSRAEPPTTVRLDLGNEDEIHKILDKVKPQVVVHCAANRFPEKCDADPEGTRALNVQATSTLAQATNNRSILLIYISTDYVFPGTPGEAAYETTSVPRPPNFYGQTKLDGEKAVLAVTASTGLGLVLRVPVLYGKAQEPKESAVNVLMDAVWKASEKSANITMDDWSIRYPTNTEDVARVLLDVTTKYLGSPRDSAASPLPKILQFSSEDRTTKYQICQLFAEIMGLPLEGMKPNQQGNDPNSTGAQRPYDCHLSTRILKDLGIDVQTQPFDAWWRREARAFRR
ncbi:MAG: hypothetical protein M1817_000590 [Caeruleum heppii]|nr:MAG: hypothetical protein M1817_000590 [Caeruleum heppii]